MFKKILIANRGDQRPRGRAATESHRLAREARGDFTAED
jgi:hypothetical protein